MAPKKDTKDVLHRVNSFISEGSYFCPDIHTRVEENMRYERGEQWSQGDVERQTARERPAIPWNSIGKVVNALANREITERYVPKAFGRTTEDAGVANALDEACRWQRDMAMTEHAETIAVRRQVASGWGVMHKFWDPTAMDGAGMIMDEDVPLWYMLWPSRARMMNLSDRRWNVCGKWIPRDEAEAFFGDKGTGAKRFFSTLAKKSVLAANSSTRNEFPGGAGHGTPMGNFGWGQIAKGFWVSQAVDQIFVVEAEWLEYEKSYRVAVPNRLQEVYDLKNNLSPGILTGETDPNTGEQQQLTQEDLAMLTEQQKLETYKYLLEPTTLVTMATMSEINDLNETYFNITGEEFDDYRPVTRNITKYAIVTDNQVWDSGTRSYGFTYEFLTGFPYELRDRMDFYGVVDVVKGPQDYKNALLSGMMAQYLASPKGNMYIDEGLLPNPAEFMDQAARPLGIVITPDGFAAAKGQRWVEGPNPAPNQMSPQLLQLASQGVEEALALSSIDFGTQGDLRRVSGTVVQSAKTASNTIVAILFDAIRKYRKRWGLLNIKMIQEYYTPEELIRVVGEDKTEDLQGIDSWTDIDRFDVKLDEEPVGITERIDLIDFLTRNGTIDRWMQSGDITFDDVLDFFLPQMAESDKRKLRERRKQRDQQAQQTQAVQAQLTDIQTKLAIFQQFVESQPQGKVMLDQWNRELGMAKVISDMQSQASQQPGQSAQGGAQ